MSKTIEVKVRLPLKIHEALTWYVRLTGHWAGKENEEEALSGYIAETVRENLDMEAGEPRAAIEEAKRVLREKLREVEDS